MNRSKFYLLVGSLAVKVLYILSWLSNLNDEYKVVSIRQVVLEETRDGNDYEIELKDKKTGILYKCFYSGRINFWLKPSPNFLSNASLLTDDLLNYYLYKYKRIMKIKKYKVESGSNHFVEMF